MLSIGRVTAGAGFEYLTKDVALSRHDYYVGKGEAPGEWWGGGLDRLSLAGGDRVSDGQMEALYGLAVAPETGEPLGRRFPLFTDGREPIAALDLTFSPVKSVSALWAIGNDELRAEVQAAHDAAVTAALAHLESVAGVSRAGVNGVRTVDTDGWIVARFRHRQSRAQDPQLHTHCAVLNRVYCPTDGRWRTLDSRAIYRLSAGAGGVYTRVLEDEMGRRLGVRWEDAGTDDVTPRREIASVPLGLRRLWSKRRAQVEAAIEDLHDTPRTAKARAQAAQAATLRTRPTKGQAEESPHERWRREATAARFNPERILAAAVPGPAEPDVGEVVDVETVLDRAVERLETNGATWRRGNMVRAVAEALPANSRSAREAAALVEELTDRLERSGRLLAIAAPDPVEVPPELRRADGASVYRPVGSIRWTTPDILAAEGRIVDAAREVDPSLVVPARTVEAVLRRGHAHGDYGPDQAAAVRALCESGRRLDLLIGPAGAGKTTTMAAVVDAWESAGGRVIGLTVAQTAAVTLGEEAGCRAENIARWLTMGALRPDDPDWHLTGGDLLLVDEVGMVTTGQLNELRRQVCAVGAKIVGVGDPLQLGPIGAGGTARLVANDVGATYLTELHRFRNPWEADASLRLREGDSDVVAIYEAAERVHGGDLETAIAAGREAWLRDHLTGRESLLLAASTGDVADLAGWCRGELVSRGLIDDTVTAGLWDGNPVGAGDLIVTRRNDRQLGVYNRDKWHVDAITRAGVAVVRHATRGTSAVLPADYVSDHVELAYAATLHAAQGRTVDTSHVVGRIGMDRNLAYVGMTRGRDENHVYVVCEDFLHDEIPGGAMDPTAAFAAVVGQEPDGLSATEALRDELKAAEDPDMWRSVADDLGTVVLRRRVLSYLGHRYGADVADGVDRDPACGALVALVDRSGTVDADPDRVLATACQRDLDGAHSIAQVLAARVRRVLNAVEDGRTHPAALAQPAEGWLPPTEAVEHYADHVGDLLERAREELRTANERLTQPDAEAPRYVAGLSLEADRSGPDVGL